LPNLASIGSSLASAVGIAAHENTAKYTELANSTVNNAIQNTTNNINNATDDLSKHAQNTQQLLLDTQNNLEEQFENAAQNTSQNVQNVSKTLKFNEIPSPNNFPSTPNNNTNLALQFPVTSPGGQFGECVGLFCCFCCFYLKESTYHLLF
jgi:ABC-type transporter Mla subunit MlaD